MRAPAIAVERVSKTYPSHPLLNTLSGSGQRGGTQALKDISFTVQEGETVGLLGPNGAGKTTLLKIICTLLHPTSGRILVHGLDLVKDALTVRSIMGLVTCDERSFYWRLTGRQNLSFFATLYGLPKARTEARVAVLLETLGLTDAADRPFHSYSSGMKQKLAIARGLLGDPQVLLYDEPTRSLDPLSSQNIRNWIVANRANSPRTAHLIATNQLREAEQLCDRVLIINRGVLIASGTIDEIRKRFHAQEQAIHKITFRGESCNGLPRANEGSGLLAIEVERSQDLTVLRVCTRPGSDALSEVLSAILRGGGKVLECESREVPFDEVFCSLIQREHEAYAKSATGEVR